MTMAIVQSKTPKAPLVRRAGLPAIETQVAKRRLVRFGLVASLFVGLCDCGGSDGVADSSGEPDASVSGRREAARRSCSARGRERPNRRKPCRGRDVVGWRARSAMDAPTRSEVDGDADAMTDAMTASDAASGDAGVMPDAMPSSDAASGDADAGADAFTPSDARGETDAGSYDTGLPDAGSPDASTPMDAGDDAEVPFIRPDGGWAQPPSPGGFFEGVWGNASNDVWAVGGEHHHPLERKRLERHRQQHAPLLARGLGHRRERRLGRRHVRDHPALERRELEQRTLGHQRGPLCGLGSGPDDAWAVGPTQLGGVILRRNGSTWSNHSTASKSLWGVWGSGPSDVWAVGSVGTILHFDGEKWDTVPSGVTEDLMAVWGTGPASAWAVGTGGCVVHLDATGWSRVQNVPYYSVLNAVHGTGPSDVWAVGSSKFILHFDGKAWTTSPSGVAQPLFGVWAADPTTAWAVGYGGTTLVGP